MLIAQFSDTHVRPRGTLYQGVTDSNADLACAIAHMQTLDRQPDVVLFSGDLTDYGEPDEYSVFLDLLEPVKQPCLLIPGNHDKVANLRRALRTRPGYQYVPDNGPLHYCIDDYPVRIVALDCTVRGKHHGNLDSASLDWLSQTLHSNQTRPTVVMLHHPPFTCHIPYMDQYRYINDDPLATVIASAPNVEMLVCGHLHRVMMRRWAGTMICSCPSTTTEIALQLDPAATDASFIGPRGYLLHHWSDPGGLLTHVVNTGEADGPYPFA